MKTSLLALLALLISASFARADGIMETYPDLQKLVAAEHPTSLYFGFGVSPFTIVNGKIGFGLSIFQLHWIKDNIDWEVFNASFSNVFGQTYGSEQMFLMRTVPKYKVFKNISIGPMLGIEFVHFADVTDELNKDSKYSKSFEYSTYGLVYGGMASETFPIGKNEFIKLNQLVFKERYSATGTENGWNYHFDQQPLNVDNSPIAASTVFLLEVSFLY